MSDYAITPDIIADLFSNNQPSQFVEIQVKDYLNLLYLQSPEKTPAQIVDSLTNNAQNIKAIIKHPEIKAYIESWLEKSAQYTNQDKIGLITNIYSNKLRNFDKDSIDNALSFLRKRHQNDGYATDEDIILTEEAKKIFELMAEYGQAIKRVFIADNINLTHSTNLAPEKMEGGVIRKSIDRDTEFKTERVDAVFASSTPIDGRNTYIALNKGMVRMDSICIYGNDNIEVTQDSEGNKHAMLREPNYIYHINPEKFTPVCTLTEDPKSGRPIFEFTDEWISDSEVVISDPNQVRAVEEVNDVTCLLDHYTILCDVQSQGIGWQARHSGSRKYDALKFITERIADGSLRNINHETGINDVDLLEEYNRE